MERAMQSATQFLEMVVAGDIDQAYEKYVDMNGVHHNAYYPAGFEALKKGMKENHVQFPKKSISVKHMLVDGDLIATHSHVRLDPTTPGIITLHLFRFESGKIVELWDCGQAIPPDSPNADGLF